MTEVKIVWTEKNTWNFVKYTIFSKISEQKFLFISTIICFVLILITSIVTSVMIQNIIPLIISICIPVIVAVYIIGYYFVLKNYAKKIYNTNNENTITSAIISNDIIVLCRDGIPVGTVSWEKISSVSVNEKLAEFYIMTKEYSLLLFDETSIISGDKEQLVQLLKRKRDEIEQSAETENNNEPAKTKRTKAERTKAPRKKNK